MEEKILLYNFDLSGYQRRDTKAEELEKGRRKKISEELEELEIDRWWEIERSDYVKFLYLVGEEGFVEIGCTTPWRSYRIKEIYEEAIAIYIASARRADDYTKQTKTTEKKQKMQEYLETLKRVMPQGIGITEMIRIIGEVRVEVLGTEYYERCSFESEVKFLPDFYEVIALLDFESSLLRREFMDDWRDHQFSKVIERMKVEGRYFETSHTVY